MGLKDVDIEWALRRLADRRIEDAMKAGKFDNLPGKGQPIELEPAPAEENARLLWWALKILRNNDVTPDEVKWRKMIETLKAELEHVRDEARLKKLVVQINVLVHKLNTLGTNAMTSASAVTGVSFDVELARLKVRVGK
jgi:hypothetical protein